ncbi:hydrogenase expression/formation protein HypE [Dongshaea marina]|uniref:hydrogenase expression/formation protein HypE n=1 Tax=Dongshaea marina TaxID=2047966 RepID=UPI000D3E32A3|nr:hydrogenase expression/formation protein HypE [Dongshaea marina]
MRRQAALDFKNGRVNLFHGSGGQAMEQLIDELFVKAFANEMLSAKNDQATFELPPGRVVMSTDSYVISPRKFPGGDIGSLAVHGTVNDVAMSGGRPLYLSAGFIIEEGFALSELREIVLSMAEAAKACGVAIVTGDTKVVERGKADGLFINTAGVGVIENPELSISAAGARPGDKILINGFLGDHGVAVMSQRPGFGFKSDLRSDSAALNSLVAAMTEVCPRIHCLRDATRGGVASVLHEIAIASGVGIELEESELPIREQVLAFCEFIGIDPLHIANEGKLVCFCPAEDADALLEVMRAQPQGTDAAIIGEVVDDSGRVTIRTEYGSTRMVHHLMGEPLPRIC